MVGDGTISPARLPPSSRGLGRRPFKPKTGVRISVGALAIKEVTCKLQVAFLIRFFSQNGRFVLRRSLFIHLEQRRKQKEFPIDKDSI